MKSIPVKPRTGIFVRLSLVCSMLASGACTSLRPRAAEPAPPTPPEPLANRGQAGINWCALSLRVPTARVEDVLGELGRAGKLLSRKVESKDIGREYHDAQILERNLDATLKRYEELLKKAELFLITAGSALYSELLGGGRRRSFNPYIGLRLGYARMLADDAFVLGGTLGLELWKSQVILVDLVLY